MAVCVFSAVALRLPAAAPANPGPDGKTIKGDLYVTGNVDVSGNSVTMGTHAASFGMALLYDDTLPDALRFRLARPGAWNWEMFDSTLALTPLMRLEPTGSLTLYSNGTATVSLDAAAKSLSLGDASLYRDSTGALHTAAAVSIGGNLSAARFTSATGALTGGPAGLTLNAGGTNQNIVLAPSGTGAVLVQGPLLPSADNLYSLGNATYRWSQLTVGGVSSFGGNVLLGITTDGGNGRLQLAAHTTGAGGIGFGPDVSLYRFSPSGLATNAPELHLVNDHATFYLGSAGDVTLYRDTAGQLRTDNNLRVGGVALIANPTNSGSSTTGALVVAGGAGVGGNLNVGGMLGATGVVTGLLVSSSVTSGTITGGSAGLALNAGGTNQNIVLTPGGTGATVLGGNVGIGTTTPAATLDVAGNASVSGSLAVAGSLIAPNYTASGGAITGGPTGLALNAGGTNQNIILTPSGAGVTLLGGNVGIGTATPAARLDVAGTLKVAGATRFDSPVRLAPQGDLPMGEFTTEPH